jgi:hypothetical protein
MRWVGVIIIVSAMFCNVSLLESKDLNPVHLKYLFQFDSKEKTVKIRDIVKKINEQIECSVEVCIAINSIANSRIDFSVNEKLSVDSVLRKMIDKIDFEKLPIAKNELVTYRLDSLHILDFRNKDYFDIPPWFQYLYKKQPLER